MCFLSVIIAAVQGRDGFRTVLFWDCAHQGFRQGLRIPQCLNVMCLGPCPVHACGSADKVSSMIEAQRLHYMHVARLLRILPMIQA